MWVTIKFGPKYSLHTARLHDGPLVISYTEREKMARISCAEYIIRPFSQESTVIKVCFLIS